MILAIGVATIPELPILGLAGGLYTTFDFGEETSVMGVELGRLTPPVFGFGFSFSFGFDVFPSNTILIIKIIAT